MYSKKLYTQIILRVVFIAIVALVMGYCLSRNYYIYGGIALVFLIVLTYRLIVFLNKTNRKIAYFFNAIKYEDFTLRFPEHIEVDSQNELHSSLNRLNQMLQNVYAQNQAQEQYYQEILRHADIGLLVIKSGGHILFANQKAQNLLNHSPLNHINQLERLDKNLPTVFSELKPFDRKLFDLTNEREKYTLSIKTTTLKLNNEPVLLAVIQDIHKELDEKETASWSKLISVLTHEIMNSITPITSISQAILKNFSRTGLSEEAIDQRDEATIQGLDVIKSQGEDLMAFVESYRSLLNVPKPDKTVVEAKRFIERIVLLCQEYNTNEIDISVSVQPNDLSLFIDENQISHVMINLIKNAIQSVGDKANGKIVITAGTRNKDEKYLSITDNGAGIPAEIMDKIFVPFFTTKTSGSGIGLSLSKQIMQLHGGTINVTSVPDQKTTFTLFF